MNFISLFDPLDQSSIALSTHYNYFLVIVALGIAFIASYVAFSLTERLSRSLPKLIKTTWLSAGALSMGTGIWAMHFIAMLAYQLPIAIQYDLLTTLLSVIPAVFASIIILNNIQSNNPSRKIILWNSVLMGSGIGAMHYIGMSAMRVDAIMKYDPALFILSIIIAVVLSAASLQAHKFLPKALSRNSKNEYHPVYAAIIMGFAISSMHYAGMMAVSFYPSPTPVSLSQEHPIDTVNLAIIIAGASFFIITMLLVSIRISQHREAEKLLLASEEMLKITVSERTAELRSAKDEAERANHAKTDFLSKMSHELRTPMNAIMGFAQLLEIDTHEPLSPGQRDSVNEILQASRHLLDLINEVLDIARVDSGRMDMAMEGVEVSHVLVECKTLISPLAQQRNITLVFKSNNQLLAYVDRIRFKQALINLLSNAVKYNKENGTITLSCEAEGDHFLKITITDTGIGIPKDRYHEVFGEFNRLNAERSEIEGAGIGLALTKRLIELMDGKIGFSSVEGEGSSFWISVMQFPEQLNLLNQDIEQCKEIMDTLNHETGSNVHDILYVEDNPASLRLIRDLFTNCSSINLLTATHPEEGLLIAKQKQPSLVLLDINLPEINGYELLAQIRAIPSLENIPAIAITAIDYETGKTQALEAGFNAFISKPVDINILSSQIKKYLAIDNEQPTQPIQS